MTLIFKICPADDWRNAEPGGIYNGSAHDARDGFIHCSTATQLAGTLAKYYGGQRDLLLIAVNADRLGEALRWENARDGDPFPHLYAALPTSAAEWVHPIATALDGTHIIPPQAKP
jgi:uncharacterized protein (DUF952 family)